MLKSSRNSVSTEVDEIDSQDFSQLYKNVAEVYDFFDAEYSRTGDIEKVREILKFELNQDNREGFGRYVIYETDYLVVFISTIDIEKEKLKVSLGVKTATMPGEYLHRTRYLDRYFDEMSHREFYSIHSEFNIVDLKAKIKKKLYFIKQWIEFQNSGYKFIDEISVQETYLFKNIDLKLHNIFSTFYFEGREEFYNKKINFILKHLKQKLENIGKISDLGYDYIKLELEAGTLFIVNENGYLYFGVRNIPSEQAEELYNKVLGYIDEIKDIQKKNKKVAKVTKKSKHAFYKSFLGKELDKGTIIIKCRNLIEEYKNSEERGETFYAPMVIDLLEDMIEILDPNIAFSAVEEAYIGDTTYLSHRVYIVRIEGYIMKNFNQILDDISNESELGFIKYYSQRLRNIQGKAPIYLDYLKNIVSNLNKLSEKLCLEEEIFDNLIHNMTYEHVQVILENINPDRIDIIDDLYKRLLEPVKTQSLDLRKFKDINNASLSRTTRELFEEKIVVNIVELLLENPEFVDNIGELLKREKLDEYIQDIAKFEEEYSLDIYGKYNFNLLYKDDFLAGKEEIDFSKYKNMNNRAVSYFMESTLIRDLFYKLKQNNDISFHQDLENLVKKGDLLEFLISLGYSDNVIDIVKSLGKEDYPDYCNKILGQWNYLRKIGEIDDYTLEGIHKTYEKYIEENIKKLFSDKYETTEDLCFKILGVNKELPEEVQKELLTFDSIKVRKELAKRKELTIEVQKMLVNRKEEAVLIEFLSSDKENRSEEVLEEIARLKNEKLCLTLIEKLPNLSENIQLILAWHPLESVRRELSKSKKLSPKVQKILLEFS